MGNCNRSNMGQRECGERYDMSSRQDFALAMSVTLPWQHFEHVYGRVLLGRNHFK